MKLQENKEKMPISVATSWIAKGWEEVGNITEMIKSIKESFTNTGNMEDYLQGIVDAYLVCIGQMENFLHDKNYVETPDVEPVKEALQEAGSIVKQDTTAWQKQVDDEVKKFGRVGGATFDDIDRDGLYVDQDNKVQQKIVATPNHIAKNFDEDWIIDWTINDTENLANVGSGSIIVDTNPSEAEIEAAKREVGGRGPAPAIAVNNTNGTHPIEDEFYVDFDGEFPEPSAQQLSDRDIEAIQGVKYVED